MIWSKDLARFFVAFLMLISFVMLILKRKNLEKGSIFFITAIGLLTFIEIYTNLKRLYDNTYNSSPVYVVGINLIVFLLFFLYFQNILKVKKLRRANLIIIALFLVNYVFSALSNPFFFSRFPFVSYFAEAVLLTGSIYLVMSQTFNSDKILKLGDYFPFWVCISLLVTYLGVLPLLIVSYTAKSLMNLDIFFAVLFMVNVVGYSLLIIGILKVKKNHEIF